jgi:hypothetical protein
VAQPVVESAEGAPMRSLALCRLDTVAIRSMSSMASVGARLPSDDLPPVEWALGTLLREEQPR